MQHLAHFALMHLLYEEQCDLGILVVWWAHRQGRGLRNTRRRVDQERCPSLGATSWAKRRTD